MIPLPNATPVILTFDQERFDVGDLHDNANPSRLTATIAGKYQITGQAFIVAGSAGVTQLSVLLNGDANNRIASVISAAAPTGQTQLDITTLWDMAVGDFVELSALQTSTVDGNVIPLERSSIEFMMARVGT